MDVNNNSIQMQSHRITGNNTNRYDNRSSQQTRRDENYQLNNSKEESHRYIEFENKTQDSFKLLNPKASMLNRIPDDIKRRLNIPIFNQNIASGVISMHSNVNSLDMNKKARPPSIMSKLPITQSRTHSRKQSRSNSGLHNLNHDHYDGEENPNSKSLNQNNISINKQHLTIPVQSPFNLHKGIKCHKYHSDLDSRLLAENQLNNNLDYYDAGHDKFLDRLDKNLSKSKCPVSIPINKTSSDNLYEGYRVQSKSINMNESMRKLKESRNNLEKTLSHNTTVKKPSDCVLSDVIDVNFSLNSPSNRKIYQNEIICSERENLDVSEREINSQSGGGFMDTKRKEREIVNTEALLEKYTESLDSIMVCLEPLFERLSLEDKIVKFLENTSDPRRAVRLGALVALYLTIKKYNIDENYQQIILEKVINLLQNYEIQEESFLVACLEILQIYSPNEIIMENMSLICMFLTDFNYKRLQKAAFNCLFSMESEGLKTLIQLASKDFSEYQSYILQSLLSTPHIQALMNEVIGNNNERRQAALAALNRMDDIIGDTEAIISLAKMFNNQKIEKILLCSILRTSGPIGEKILINELRTNKDPNIRSAISSCLQYRIPKEPIYLDIRLDNNDTYAVTRSLPGSFCTYYGDVSPIVYSNSETRPEEYLEVNSRDFLASLQRMISLNLDHSNPRILHLGKLNILDHMNQKLQMTDSDSLQKYIDFYKEDNKEEEEEEDLKERNSINGRMYINEEVIRALCYCMRDYHKEVKISVITTLGLIAVPEGLLALESLIQATKEEDTDIRAKAILAIGTLAHACDDTIIPSLIEGLKCNIWKVKIASMHTLSLFGEKAARHSLPLLVKLLRESPINKNIIADTIIKLGEEGEEALLKIMRTEADSQYKLKAVVTRAFALTNLNSPNIDFIVEILYKCGQSLVALIRKSSLYSIRVLQSKSNEQITYLKIRHILPFYYKFLRDKETEIQSYAISGIKDLGPQGELLFIEGLSKDSNPVIRAQCAIGLSEIGPQTLRTLLLGLFDENILVRKTVEREILNKFSLESMIEMFQDKNSQKLSLKIALRDVLEKDIPMMPEIRELFKDILLNFDNMQDQIPEKTSGFRYTSNLNDPIKEHNEYNNSNSNSQSYKKNENYNSQSINSEENYQNLEQSQKMLA